MSKSYMQNQRFLPFPYFLLPPGHLSPQNVWFLVSSEISAFLLSAQGPLLFTRCMVSSHFHALLSLLISSFLPALTKLTTCWLWTCSSPQISWCLRIDNVNCSATSTSTNQRIVHELITHPGMPLLPLPLKMLCWSPLSFRRKPLSLYLSTCISRHTHQILYVYVCVSPSVVKKISFCSSNSVSSKL